MKITKSQLKKVIKEELAGILAEQAPKKAGFFKRAFKMKSDEVEKMIRNVGAALDRLEGLGPDPEYLEAAHIEIDKFGGEADDSWYRKMSAATGDPDQRKRVSALRQRAEAFAGGLDDKAVARAAQKSKEEEEYRAREKAQEKAAQEKEWAAGRERDSRYKADREKRLQGRDPKDRRGIQTRDAFSENKTQKTRGKTKITKSQLKKVIQEEMEKILTEA